MSCTTIPSSGCPGPESFSKPFVKALGLLFLPYLSAFLLQSNHLLRVYIAVLVAAVPTPNPPEPEQIPDSVDRPSTTSGQKWRIIPAILALSIVSFVQFQAAKLFPNFTLETAEAFGATVNKYFLYTCLFICVTDTTVQIVYPTKDVIHRTPDGKYVTVKEGGLRSTAKEHPFWILLLTLSIALFAYVMVTSASDTTSNNSLAIAVVTMAYVANAIMVGTIPLRNLISVFVVVFILSLFTLIKYNRRYLLEEDEVWSTNLFKNLRYLSFLPAAISSFCSGPFIATMLRFDFNRFCVAEPHARLSFITTPHPSDPKMGQGVVVPQSVPIKFPKPYYTLALFTWSMIRITTLLVCITTGFPFKSPYDACTLGILLEVPIMTIVILLFANMKGEARALWEAWVKKPLVVKKSAPVAKEGEPIVKEGKRGELITEKEGELVVKGELLLFSDDNLVVSPNEDLMV